MLKKKQTNRTSSTVRSSLGVHGGNLHNIVFSVIPDGNSFAMKECTCLFRVGFLQAISRPSIIYLPRGDFLGARNGVGCFAM